MNRAFWNGRRVFLTGHTGFKGSWLALWLSSLGSEVTGYARAPLATQPLYDLLKLDDCITSVIGDVTDRASLETVIKDASPEIVIHMAAQPLVQLSYEDPVDTYNTNVMGTVHLLDVVRSVPSVRSFISFVSLFVRSCVCVNLLVRSLAHSFVRSLIPPFEQLFGAGTATWSLGP